MSIPKNHPIYLIQNWTMVDSGGGIQQRDIDRAEKYFRFYLELLQIVEQETA